MALCLQDQQQFIVLESWAVIYMGGAVSYPMIQLILPLLSYQHHVIVYVLACVSLAQVFITLKIMLQ